MPFFPCPYFTDPRILAFQQTKLCLFILLKNFPCILYATTFGIHVNQATTQKHIQLKTTVNDSIRLNTAVNDPCLWTCFLSSTMLPTLTGSSRTLTKIMGRASPFHSTLQQIQLPPKKNGNQSCAVLRFC
jgi:hypothetical protein